MWRNGGVVELFIRLFMWGHNALLTADYHVLPCPNNFENGLHCYCPNGYVALVSTRAAIGSHTEIQRTHAH